MEECEAAAAVRSKGAQPFLIDAPAMGYSDEQVMDKVAAIRPDLIILSSVFGSLEADLAWAARLKLQFPNIIIGVRGAPAYVMSESILTGGFSVDFCVKGDYEPALEDIVSKGFRGAPAVDFLDDSGNLVQRAPCFVDNLDALPFPNIDVLDLPHYRVRGMRFQQITVHVQRGCGFRCIYCLASIVAGDKVRQRSAISISEEISVRRAVGYRFFYLRAETFTVERQWALDVCRTLIKEHPGIKWCTSTRIDKVDKELIQAMANSGCYGISFGVETGSEMIGKRIGKLPDLEKAREIMRLCDRYGVLSMMYVMIGFPWDTRDSIRESQTFVRKTRPDLISVFFAHPYPGTPYYRMVLETGRQVKATFAQSKPAFDTDNLQRSELVILARKLIARHYFSVPVLFSITKKMARLSAASLFSMIRSRLTRESLAGSN